MDANIIRIYNSGMDPHISMNLCKYKSVLPAKYPCMAPKNNPITIPIAVRAIANMTDNLNP